VSVALDDLRTDRVDRQTKLGHHLGLDFGIQLAVGPDRARQLARCQVVGRGRESVAVARELEGPRRELQTEGDRLGMDRVRPTHHHRRGMLARAPDEQRHEQVELGQQ
jgi:hypothetical protein